MGYDGEGNKKNIGGDEYYVSFLDDAYDRMERNFTAVAYVKDMGDGRYELEFVEGRYVDIRKNERKELLERGTLSIFLQYTCNIGRIWPPGKKTWQSTGGSYREYHVNLIKLPPMRPPSPPVLSTDLKDYDVILALGDSVMVQLFCTKLRMRRHNMYINGNIGSTLDAEHMHRYGDWVRYKAYPVLKPFRKKAILFNSGAWDIAKHNDDGQTSFDDHLKTLRRLITYIKKRMPNVDIIWRSTTAMHIHRAPDLERLFYVSNSRVKALHDAQLQVVNEFHIPVLDVYNYTYEMAWHTKPNDAIHYYDWVSAHILDALYPYDQYHKNIIYSNDHIGHLCREGYEILSHKQLLSY